MARSISIMDASANDNRPVRRLGFLLLPLVLLEGALGVASAGRGIPTVSILLIAHMALGVGVVAFALWIFFVALGRHSQAAKLATGFTAASLVSTGSTGAAFLITGFSQGLVVDRVLALMSLAGAVLMIIVGRQQIPK